MEKSAVTSTRLPSTAQVPGCTKPPQTEALQTRSLELCVNASPGSSLLCSFPILELLLEELRPEMPRRRLISFSTWWNLHVSLRRQNPAVFFSCVKITQDSFLLLLRR
jgi:hypothetical protein